MQFSLLQKEKSLTQLKNSLQTAQEFILSGGNNALQQMFASTLKLCDNRGSELMPETTQSGKRTADIAALNSNVGSATANKRADGKPKKKKKVKN